MYGHAVGLRPARYEIVLHAAQAGDWMPIIAGADLVALLSPPYQLSTAPVSRSLHKSVADGVRPMTVRYSVVKKSVHSG
jgi:hypothetical protein